MALPAGVETVTLSSGEPLTLPDGTPQQGQLTFTGPQLITFGDDGLVAGGTVTVPLVDGEFTVTLLATDATGMDPTGWTYKVRADLTNAPDWTRYVTLPKATPDVVLADVLIPDPVVGSHSTLLPTHGGVVSGRLVIDVHGAPADYPIGPAGAVESLSIPSSFAGGDDDGATGHFDSTGRLNLYSYQRAWVQSFGETIRHFLMRKDAKAMEAWYFPSGGYDADRNPVGSFKPVVWAGAHWEANNHASNHKHWSVETPDTTGAIQTRFEVRFGDPTVDDAIAGLNKTLIMTNLADFVVRCSNGQELRLSSPNGQEKTITFSRDSEGDPQYRRWKLRSTDESETGSNAGANFQLARYGDDGALLDIPIAVSRATGNVTLGPGVVARRSSSTSSSLSLNTTSLGGGVGVVAIGNAEFVPVNTPSGGGVLYAEGGALKWKGSNGQVTTIAAA